MSITSIQRNLEGSPNIVYVQTTDNLDVITTDGYLLTEQPNIDIINKGNFVFLSDDCVLINYGNGEGFFNVDLTNLKFVILPLAAPILQYAVVPLTAAEFNGMYAVPKLLVADPGADKLLVLEQVQLLLTYNSVAYAAGGTAAVQYDSTAHGAGVIASTTLADTAFQVTASTGLVLNAGVVPETFTTCVHKGLYLSNITGAFTTGNSAMVAHVWYRTIPTV